MVFVWIIVFSAIASIGSILAASASLLIKEEKRARYIPWLVAYATGTLLASAIVGLIPEALEQYTGSELEP